MHAKSQTLLISSSNCSNPITDMPWDYGITFAPDLVSCRPNEKLRLTLKRVCARATWTWVPYNCKFTVTLLEAGGYTFHDVFLPAGNPTFKDLAASITKQVNVPGFSCTINKATLLLVFTYYSTSNLAQPFVQLDFTEFPIVQKLLGFGDGNGNIVYSSGATLQSDEVLSDTPFDSIKIHVQGINAESQHATNIGQNDFMQGTDLIAAITVDSSAFSLLDWRNVDDSFSMTITDKTIRSLRFQLTDWQNLPLTQMSHHFLYIVIETIREEPSLVDIMQRLFVAA